VTPGPRARPTDADRLAFRAVAGVCRRDARDLYFASAFLPRAKRDAACAVYAFFNLVREAITSAGEEAGAARLRHQPLNVTASAHAGSGHDACCSSDPLGQRLSLLGERLDELYAGRLELPAPAARSEQQHVLHAFAVASARYQVPREALLDFAEACRAELTVSRYATWASLERYCRSAGGSVARAAACVLGVTNSGAGETITEAGVAIRLTRILCELKADVAHGRVYLPLEDLAAFRYTERELAAGIVNDNFRRLMRFQIERARQLYDEAARGLRWVANDGSRHAAALLLTRQLALLDVVERHGYDVFARQPALTWVQKLLAFPMSGRLAKRVRAPLRHVRPPSTAPGGGGGRPPPPLPTPPRLTPPAPPAAPPPGGGAGGVG
jgi:phytoene synthase